MTQHQLHPNLTTSSNDSLPLPKRKYTKRSFSPNSPNPRDGILMEWLHFESVKRGTNLKQMALEIGVTYGYINHLRSGLRNVSELSEKMTYRIAKYLNVAPIVIKLASGRIRLEDFIEPSNHMSESELQASVIRKLKTATDPDFKLPFDIEKLPLESQRDIVNLYMANSKVDVLKSSALPALIQSLRDAAQVARSVYLPSRNSMVHEKTSDHVSTSNHCRCNAGTEAPTPRNATAEVAGPIA